MREAEEGVARLPCGCCGQKAPGRRVQYQPFQGPCRGKKEGATYQSKVTASSLLFKEREHRIKAMEKTEVELLSFWLCSLADPLEGQCVD